LTPACPRIKLTGVAKLFARIVKLLTPKHRWATLLLFVNVLYVGLALGLRRATAGAETHLVRQSDVRPPHHKTC
jgi:hypothetical protein